MKRSAIIRFKGSRWEAMASASSQQERTNRSTGEHNPARQPKTSRIESANAILLDLAIRHFRALQLTASEVKKLASGLRRCLRGEAVDVGPLGGSHRTYSFRRHVNAVSIQGGEGRMRLPLSAATALSLALKNTFKPRMTANNL